MLVNLVLHAPSPRVVNASPSVANHPVQIPNIPSHIGQLSRRQNRPVQQFKLFHLALMRVFIRLIGKHPHELSDRCNFHVSKLLRRMGEAPDCAIRGSQALRASVQGFSFFRTAFLSLLRLALCRRPCPVSVKYP